MKFKNKYTGFTLVELLVVLAVISIVASIVTFGAVTIQKTSRDSARDAQVGIIANSLEKYYRENGEYPSVAAMTSANVDTVKQKLGISNPTVFKLPLATTTNSIVTTGASPTKVVYSANTTDTTKNAQCQTDVNGYCDGYTLAYVKEASGTTQTAQSLHSTFQAIKTECDPGDPQSGNTCTHTYTATYQAGTYSCPSGGTASGSTCTKTYTASYNPPTSGYYCPSGGTLSGTTCTTSGSYAATYTPSNSGTYSCPSGGTLNGTTCTRTYTASYSSGGTYYYCDSGYTLSGTTCYGTPYNGATNYSCPNGGSLSGTTCTMSATSTTTYSCPNGGTLSGTTCTKAANSQTTQYCPHSADSDYNLNHCRHDRSSYNTQAGCQNAGYTWSGGSCFEIHTKTSQTLYSCDSGWSISSGSCTQSANMSVTYSCPSGWSQSGSSCSQSAQQNTNCGKPAAGTSITTNPDGTCTASKPANSSTSSGYYYCNSGDTLSGSTCTNTYNATYTANPGTYSCPNGGSLSGTTCNTSGSYAATYYSNPGYYYCNSGDTLSGSTCTNTYTGTQAPGYYTCPQGGVASGSTCSYTYQLS